MLKQKIFDEGRRFIDAIIPFNYVFSNRIKNKQLRDEEGCVKPKEAPYFALQVAVSAVMPFALAYYFWMAVGTGTINYKKWSEITEQKTFERQKIQELFQQSSYRQQFHKLDKNNDYVIDSTEFIYRNQEKK